MDVKKKPPPTWAVVNRHSAIRLGRVGKDARIRDVRNRDGYALRKVRGIDFEGNRAEVLNIAIRSNQASLHHSRYAVFQIVLVGGRSELTHIIQDSLVLR